MNRIILIVRWFLLLDDVQWFLKTGLTPEQERHAFGILRAVLLRVGLVGGLGGIVLAWGAITATSQAGISAVPGATTDAINIVARAPGTDPAFALNFCNDPATVVSRPRFPVPEQDGGLEASRGTDTLTWPGFGVSARYQTSTDGRDIDITPKAVECLKGKVK